MNILVINAGSSSMKYQVINVEKELVLAKGNYEGIGFSEDLPDHTTAFHLMKEKLTNGEEKVLDIDDISAIGHRVVQGGSIFDKPVVIDEKVMEEIDKLAILAPLHNKAHLEAIKACFEVFGDKIPQVAVFDNAFFKDLPEKAYLYGLPYEYYEKYKIRKYGFHGTSHKYVYNEYLKIKGEGSENLKVVTCHLGNGSSISAIENHRAVDTTMGLTPLEGLIMGTRSGSVDPAAVLILQELENLSPQEMMNVLNKKSGLRSISGISYDMRQLRKATLEGNKRAQIAIDMLAYQVAKYIGSYAVAMGGLDAIVFTGGIGEHSFFVRSAIMDYLKPFGLTYDKEKNDNAYEIRERLSNDDSKIEVYEIPTNEELEIALETKEVICS